MNILVSFEESAGFSVCFDDEIETESVQFDELSVRWMNDIEEYDESYLVQPKVVSQVLSTASKVLTDDITIDGIPYSAVSNDKGGLTATIGGIM